jgi:hypothetical protein
VSARVTGVQAALAAFVALLDAWRAQFSPHEYAVLLDLLARRLTHELAREELSALPELGDALDREPV